jgi:tRNA dimethylallyltransferase
MISPSASEDSPLLVVLGPTGSGKSELALALARHVRGEIVNCDSIQVYRGFDIGSAKTPIEHRSGIPHHLIDVIGPGEELSAGSYARAARQVIAGIRDRRGVPVVVGGTGFYLRALLDGLSPAPGRDDAVRDRLQQIEARRPTSLHRFLRRYDLAAAARIHPNDTQKLIRAVELTLLSGHSATRAQSTPRQAFAGVVALKVGLNPDRKILYSRLNARTTWMFDNGLMEETRQLLESGYLPHSKPMQSLGYRQALRVISGQCSRESAVAECQAKTRQYAKRQITWFRAEPDVLWMSGFGSEREVQAATVTKSIAFLKRFEYCF